jgi:DNA-binding Xre family transcriptional regulator
MITWHLNEVMARHRIKVKDLAHYLGVNSNAVSNLKHARTMPRLDGQRLNQILMGLNQLADPATIKGHIELQDLLDWVSDSEET